MTKRILFILLLFVSFGVKAQVKPIYFYMDSVISDSTKATSYAIYGKLSTEELWSFKRYDLYNNLLQTGSFKDEQLTIPHGKFTSYMEVDLFNKINNSFFYIRDRDRFISQVGSFVNGKEHGQWLSYYPDGKIFGAVIFRNGVLHGESKSYDKKGNIEIVGNYVNGKKDGEWILHGGLQKDVYVMDELKSSTKDKKLIRKEKQALSTN